MRRTTPDPDMPVDEIMRRWPATIRLFIRHGMLCVGCPIGTFHTLADACAAHQLDQPAFEAELIGIMQEHGAADVPAALRQPAADAGQARAGGCGG